MPAFMGKWLPFLLTFALRDVGNLDSYVESPSFSVDVDHMNYVCGPGMIHHLAFRDF